MKILSLLLLQILQNPFGTSLSCCCFSSDTSLVCGSAGGELFEVDLRNHRQAILYIICTVPMYRQAILYTYNMYCTHVYILYM